MKQIIFFLFIAITFIAASKVAPTSNILSLSHTALWLTTDDKNIFALLDSGEVLRADGKALVVVAKNWSPEAPIKFAYGRLHGITAQGELGVLEDTKLRSSNGAKLSLNSGLLPLPAGVIAITKAGDLVRLEARNEQWEITARAKLNVLTDGRIAFADLEGDNDNEVVALISPSNTRYQHGILGDTTEATAIVALERHSLEVLWRYDLPAPYVFEDLTVRPIRIGTRDHLAVVRSSPTGGAALALLSLKAGKLELNAGQDFGQANRWLNPIVGFGEIYAINTPHIGGVLHQYSTQLQSTKQLENVSNHSIGSRHLELALTTAPKQLITLNQSYTKLEKIDCQKSCIRTAQYNLNAVYSSNLIQLKNTVSIATKDNKLHFWQP